MAWEPDYTTPEDLANFVRIGDTADDVQLGLAIATASRAIDRACNRQFGVLATAAARYYTARWDTRLRQWAVDIDDLMTTTDLAVAFDEDEDQTYSGTITAYHLQPRNAAADGRPWAQLYVRSTSAVQPTCLRDGVRVTALWGWSAVPPAIEQACLLQASRLLSRRDSPHGVAGSPETGSEVRLMARLDVDVAVAIRPFRRMWGAV
jgi:hypothetical protein